MSRHGVSRKCQPATTACNHWMPQTLLHQFHSWIVRAQFSVELSTTMQKFYWVMRDPFGLFYVIAHHSPAIPPAKPQQLRQARSINTQQLSQISCSVRWGYVGTHRFQRCAATRKIPFTIVPKLLCLGSSSALAVKLERRTAQEVSDEAQPSALSEGWSQTLKT